MKREKSCGAVVFMGNKEILIDDVLLDIDYYRVDMELVEIDVELLIRDVR